MTKCSSAAVKMEFVKEKSEDVSDAETHRMKDEDTDQQRDVLEVKKQLKEMQKTFQQRIQQREKDVQQLREAVESHKRSAQTEVEDSEWIFTELIRSIERSLSELIRLIRDQEKAAVSRAEGRLERLEQEINDLRRRDAELEQLSHTQDHIQFLQSFQSLSAPPESTDGNDKPFISFFSSDVLREFVHQLRDKLEDFCKEELKKISDRVTVTSTNIVPRTRKDFLQYSHRLSIDPNTAHKLLCLSENNRTARRPGQPCGLRMWAKDVTFTHKHLPRASSPSARTARRGHASPDLVKRVRAPVRFQARLTLCQR
ncbi:hypothetical protein Q8A67_009608 [Cirrhinus molitorella]|uniref:TRIM8/14/16/25/29/45/65 coiled-coil region domain-containing protein n=1 Tax=Cirrhinus molitorella TaxID=172907 RepID=A0AA88PUS7_9TELE|nr:hypothetical protein Q8A67_009608 [Cirrhinus molitorella]